LWAQGVLYHLGGVEVQSSKTFMAACGKEQQSTVVKVGIEFVFLGIDLRSQVFGDAQAAIRIDFGNIDVVFAIAAAHIGGKEQSFSIFGNGWVLGGIMFGAYIHLCEVGPLAIHFFSTVDFIYQFFLGEYPV